MKYFTYELWKGFNSRDEKIRIKANDEWKTNIKLYKNEFKKAQVRLTKKFLKTLDKNNYFHDFYLNKMDIEEDDSKKKLFNLILTLKHDKEVWTMKYINVNKINMNYSLEYNKLGFGKGLCTIGYSEFLEVNENLLSHEILFSSGGTILLWFEKVKAEKTKIKA